MSDTWPVGVPPHGTYHQCWRSGGGHRVEEVVAGEVYRVSWIMEYHGVTGGIVHDYYTTSRRSRLVDKAGARRFCQKWELKSRLAKRLLSEK